MKTLTALLLAFVATSAMAANNEPAATPYDPAHPLDIAKVVSVSDTPTGCDVVPATMSTSIIRARLSESPIKSWAIATCNQRITARSMCS